MRFYSFFSFLFISSFLGCFSPVLAVDLSVGLQKKLDNASSQKSKNDLVRNAAHFYKGRNFKQIWVTEKGFTPAAEKIVDVLKKAALEGLDPRDYRRAIQLVEGAKKDPQKLLEAEIALSSYALEYIDDILGERLNPRKIGKALYLKAKNIDAVKIMTEGMEKDASAQWLQELTIHHPEYKLLKAALSTYRKDTQQRNYPRLAKGKKIELGTKGGRVEVLQWQLSSLGYLTKDHPQGSVDEATQEAIKLFQKDNYLTIDGIVGTLTISRLNGYDPQERIRQIIISMERWRWLPEDLGERYLQVNIAAFELKAIEKGVEALRMPVIIGRRYRKTPVFSSDLYAIRFNPSWHVPRSIAVKDKLKKIRQDPGYLDRGQFILYDSSGVRLNPRDVDWESVSESNFNFRLRQLPGANNALGKIRFSIRNPFSIYLHSTPQKELFKKNIRSFSSGCIRVDSPKELAVFVFNDQQEWPYERVSKNMEGVHTKNVSLKQPMKVYITYFTVWKSKDGNLLFASDIYGQDRAIWNALQRRKR